MAKPFKGVVNVDVTESVPDWGPYTQPIAPESTPSVVYIVLDDVGFSAMEPFGGLIETPNINRIAERGLLYTNFHTTALCSPTRSCLMTGRNHTTNGMATITEAASGFPSSNGHIPFECGTIAEVLGERGWNTYMSGKWHLTPEDEMNLASVKTQWPVGRGFERFYGFLGAETNQWYPDLVYDNHPVEQPSLPEEGYHLTTDLTDHALAFIRDAKAIAPDKPFFLYYCPGACHAPHHAPKEWADRYKGKFDMGYDVLVSDNGASGEGGPNGSVNENTYFNGIQDNIEKNLSQIDDLGSPLTYNHYPTGWACAFNTPFKLWKRYSNWEGGTADPMIVSWPAKISQAGVRRQYTHAVDIVPTIYECLGVEPPEVVKGYTQHPLEGVSFAATFDDPDATTDKQTQFYSMGGTRAIWHQGWKAVSVSPSAPDMWAHYATQRWELFDTTKDPTESHDLAAEHPAKLQELIGLWWSEAGRYQALPLENRNALEIITTERPQLSKPRNRYVYYPGGSEVPESVAPNIRNRSYTIAVEVTIDTEEAGGVLFAHGSRFGGHALYIKDRKLKYVYNWVGQFEQIVESTEPVPTGHVVLSASFQKEGDGMPTEGTLTLHIREKAVGEAKIKTQPGKFSIAGEGLNIGKEGAEPVTDDYPGEYPWAFVGGTIERAAIDVSGDAFVDLANEVKMAFARD
jgi:arylsulfatase A-like enzyme